MKKSIPIFAVMLFEVVLFLSVSANAQDVNPTIEPLPTRPRNSPFWDVFPGNLYCHDIGSPSEGPTWGEIIIGTSSVENLKAYVGSISESRKLNKG